MTISIGSLLPVALALPLVLAGGPARAGDTQTEFGVYEYVLESTGGTIDDAGGALESALSAEGWRLLANVDAGVPQGCRYKARVLAVVDPEYAQKLMAANRRTAPFAVVDRINVFEDEGGVHVAVLNAESVNRTVLMDDSAYADLSRAHVEALRALVIGAVTGNAIHREFGEKRSRGYIGKTMGVMAGGPFGEKIKDEAVVGSGDWKAVAEKVRQGLARSGGKWGLHLAYELELPEQETVIFGSTGSPLDRKSFSIVGAGGDAARDSFQCPGLAHAAAYPIEVVVTRDGAAVKVRLVDTMYRMKMYFEDAGKWAFMKNMGMPGSVHDELAAQIKSGLGQP
jgi:uncharacterized protein YcfJ